MTEYFMIKSGNLYIGMAEKGYIFFQTRDKANQYKILEIARFTLNLIKEQLDYPIGSIVRITFNEQEIVS